MSGFELFGYVAAYVIGVVFLAYALAGLAAFIQRNRGLEGMFVVIYSWFGTMIIGAVVGLVLLGRMIP